MKPKKVRKRPTKRKLGRRHYNSAPNSKAKRVRRGAGGHGSSSREYGVQQRLITPFTLPLYDEVDVHDLLDVRESSFRLRHPTGTGYAYSVRDVDADYGAGFFSNENIRLRCRFNLVKWDNVANFNYYFLIHNNIAFDTPYAYCRVIFNESVDRIQYMVGYNLNFHVFHTVSPVKSLLTYISYLEMIITMSPPMKVTVNVYSDEWSNLLGSGEEDIDAGWDEKYFHPWRDAHAFAEDSDFDLTVDLWSISTYLLGVLDLLYAPLTEAPYVETDTNDLLTVGENSIQLKHSDGDGNFLSGTTRVLVADYGDGFFSDATAEKIRIRWKYDLAENDKSWTSYFFIYETVYFVSPFVFVGFTKSTGSNTLRFKINCNGTQETYPIILYNLDTLLPLTRYIELILEKGEGIDRATCNVYTDEYKTLEGSSFVSCIMDFRFFCPWYDNTGIINTDDIDEKFSEYSMVKYL